MPPAESTTRSAWPRRKCSSAAVEESTSASSGWPGRWPETSVKGVSAVTLMPKPAPSSRPSRPSNEPGPPSRPSAAATPGIARTAARVAAGRTWPPIWPGGSPDSRSATATLTFRAPAEKLPEYEWLIEALIISVPATNATPRTMARADRARRPLR